MTTTVPVRRPAMTAAVLTSLEQLTCTTPSTDATELGLRHPVIAERSPEIREKRAKFNAYVKQHKLDNGVTQPGRKRGRPTVKGFN